VTDNYSFLDRHSWGGVGQEGLRSLGLGLGSIAVSLFAYFKIKHSEICILTKGLHFNKHRDFCQKGQKFGQKRTSLLLTFFGQNEHRLHLSATLKIDFWDKSSIGIAWA